MQGLSRKTFIATRSAMASSEAVTVNSVSPPVCRHNFLSVPTSTIGGFGRAVASTCSAGGHLLTGVRLAASAFDILRMEAWVLTSGGIPASICRQRAAEQVHGEAVLTGVELTNGVHNCHIDEYILLPALVTVYKHATRIPVP